MSNKTKEKEAWDYYKTWQKEKTYSPALKSKILITKKGWDHIKKGSKTRKRRASDKHNKFNLLKLAKYIIKTVKQYEIENRNNEKYFVLKISKDKDEIRVLIKEDKKGNKYFYSVMKH